MERHKRPALAATRGESAASAPSLPPVLEIPELLECILSLLDEAQDLVNVACTARRFKDTALRIAWTAPDSRGAPLLHMAHLFPPQIAEQLLRGQIQDDQFRVPVEDFDKFDYYAKFVRHVELWRAVEEANIARILSQSRPNRWFFPFLETVHMGATGEALEITPPYLTPTLRSVRINHWDLEESSVLTTEPVVNVLLQILTLPHLESLDLLDTRYPAFEHNIQIVGALLNVIPQLRSFLSSDFTTLPPVFEALSKSSVLTGLFIDLCWDDGDHLRLGEITTAIRHSFASLRRLVLLCSQADAIEFLRRLGRQLTSLEVRIEGALSPDGLASITDLLLHLATSLAVFKCASSQSERVTSSRPLREAFEPMIRMSGLEHIHIVLTFHGVHMLKDADVPELFSAWPRLCTFIIESDPQDADPVMEDDPEGYGLTLNSLVDIARFCPFLIELTLAYLDTSAIPDLSSRDYIRSHVSLALHLSRSHVHDQQSLFSFIARLWPHVELSYKTCCPSLVQAHD